MCGGQEMLENADTGREEGQWCHYCIWWSICSIGSQKYLGGYVSNQYWWMLLPKEKKKDTVMKMKPEWLDKTQIPLVLILQQKTITARLWLLDVGQVHGVDPIDMADGVQKD